MLKSLYLRALHLSASQLVQHKNPLDIDTNPQISDMQITFSR